MPGSQWRAWPGQLVAHSGVTTLITGDGGCILRGREGFFVEEMRLLSRAELSVNGQPPAVFSCGAIGHDRLLIHARVGKSEDLLEDALFLETEWTLIDAQSLRLSLRLVNHAPSRVRPFDLRLRLAADFADFQDALAGRANGRPQSTEDWDHRSGELLLRADASPLEVAAKVSVRSQAAALMWSDGEFSTEGELRPQADARWVLECSRQPRVMPGAVLPAAAHPVRPPSSPTLTTSNPDVALAWRTAVADLSTLPLGLEQFPKALGAGVPLYQHFFGRDSLTAGWQALLAGPEYLRDALRVNASLQGTKVDDWLDEQPGKMIHEVRHGPNSLTGKDALLRNYGDYATPPDFVAMLSQYYTWTGDMQTTRQMLPAAWKALGWLERYGDIDSDGFLEYVTRSPKGVKNQGWKDAPDSIVDDDGKIAENPLATSELQAYWYAALQLGSFLAASVGHDVAFAWRLRRRAKRLREQFNARFWLEDEGHYALALDAKKRPIRAAGSNDAHLLVTGIVPQERARQVVKRLFEPDIFTGWGIRTLNSKHPAYNPFSYHRGSVWPVEHGTFALGLARYGFWEELGVLAKGVFDAASLFEGHRLPEVIGGNQREAGGGGHPGIYPDACSPQAWTASTVVALVQAMLGLNPLTPYRTVLLDPHLPEWLPDLRLEGVRVGASTIDIRAWRDQGGKSRFEVTNREKGRMVALRQPPPQDSSAGVLERLKILGR